MDILISNLLSESILDFGKWSNRKTRIRIFAYFPFGHFPKSKIDSKADLKWKCLYFYFKFFFEEFRPILKKSQKMDFPLYFKILILKWPKVL